MNIRFFTMTFILFTIASSSLLLDAATVDELKASCLKNQKGMTDKDCQCLADQILSHEKIKGLFKMTDKKFGPKFKESLLIELKTTWWTSSQYRDLPKDRKLNDKEASILAISLNATMACMPKRR